VLSFVCFNPGCSHAFVTKITGSLSESSTFTFHQLIDHFTKKKKQTEVGQNAIHIFYIDHRNKSSIHGLWCF